MEMLDDTISDRWWGSRVKNLWKTLFKIEACPGTTDTIEVPPMKEKIYINMSNALVRDEDLRTFDII